MDVENVKVVLIDNHDSFTYNLVDELRVLGVELKVFRNSVDVGVVFAQLESYRTQGPTLLMLSPGPGAPKDAGNMPQVIERAKGQYPVLGICLGHQAIVEAYGGEVGRAEDVMHGKASLMQHSFEAVFEKLPQPLSIARYHSLVATRVPDCLQVIAHIQQLPMALHHPSDNMLGFQFHPESILTAQGSRLLKQAILYLVSSRMPSQIDSKSQVNCSQTLKQEGSHG
uniref:aminodeoxychorismate/anthranilate synthase component II n=1 Tax=Ningiella ruwaisensis TaxID=2364274 RepID=UPI00109F64C3|nr:aminodeoxychorismate/anthranilate synthase component II [Ningiella ruwaisensis]